MQAKRFLINLTVGLYLPSLRPHRINVYVGKLSLTVLTLYD